jgi:para-nitrobenzyl esterase
MQQMAYATTAAGRVCGSSNDNIYTFKGIPYGKDTGGARRFMAPQQVEPWTGVRNTTELGPQCPQTTISVSDVDAEFWEFLRGGPEPQPTR